MCRISYILVLFQTNTQHDETSMKRVLPHGEDTGPDTCVVSCEESAKEEFPE